MKKILFFAVLLLATTLQAKTYHYETVPGDLMQTRIYTLDNGLKVYLSVNKEKPRIQTYIAVRTGSKNDPAETTGLAHYLEHLMFKGTDKFGVSDPEAEAPLLDDIEARYEDYRRTTDPALRKLKYHQIDSVSQIAAQYFIPNEYDKLMSAIGAEGTNAYTSNDVTCYTEDIPSNEIENWAKIQADRFQNMVIRGFHTELEAVYEEYNIGLARDNNKLWEALSAKLFPTHPYGTQTTIGTQEHLKNPSITNIKNYFRRWYVPNNVAVCMAGDFNPDEVVEIIDRYFGSWKPGDDVAQPTFAPMAPITSPADTTVYGLEAETLWLGWRFGRGNTLAIDTLDVIGDILSNGTAGLIDLDIKQQMKMLDSWAGSDAMRDYSIFIMAGTPKEGQTLDQVKELLLGEINKLKKGDFADDLLPSVVNNKKLAYYNSLESNRSRASRFVDAFINEIDWKQQCTRLERIEGMTKQQIVDFANRHFGDNYVAVYKRQGEDTTQKKIDKPAITPIPTNRDKISSFVTDIQNSYVEPIQPKFVDFKTDLTFGKTKKNIPVLYVKNNENGRFQLAFRYEFGEEADLRYCYAAEYIDLLGTDRLTPAQLKQQFYKLACSYNIRVGERNITVSLSGLSENMQPALALLEDLLHNAKVDPEAYQQYVAVREKQRADMKANQRANFQALVQYGVYGPYNSFRNAMTAQQLLDIKPQTLLDLLKNLSNYEHTVLYYGPMTMTQLDKAVTAAHKTGNKFAPVPANKHYTLQATPDNEVIIAPYDAKSIYMRMFHNELRPLNLDEAPVVELFNEYFGGGMNTIVFQEMREARGLAYNASAMYVTPAYKEEPEYFFTHIITQNDKMMDCVNHFHTILDTIPQSEKAFKIAKDALTKRLQSDRTTKFGIINAWLWAQRLGIDYDLDKTIYDALPGITLQDIVNFEQKNMARKPYRYIILGDEKELDLDALGKIAPIRRVTTEEIFGY